MLIIGILSAIALPQYQKAVAKARASEAMTTIASLKKSISLWVLSNGLNSANFLGGNDLRNASLDLDFPDCKPISSNSDDCFSSSGIFYSATCYEDSCEIKASGGNNGWYTVVSVLNQSGEWYFNKCGYDGTTGKAVCDSFAALGWEIEEGWDI